MRHRLLCLLALVGFAASAAAQVPTAQAPANSREPPQPL
jgi:hypothetical protein